MIHLRNAMHNNRVDLLYGNAFNIFYFLFLVFICIFTPVVEADDERIKQVQTATGIENTKFVNCSQIDQVLDDPMYYSLKCLC